MSEKDPFDAILNMKKSIRYLDEKMNDSIGLNKKKFEHLDQGYEGLFADTEYLSNRLNDQKEANSILMNMLSLSKEENHRLEARLTQLEAIVDKNSSEHEKALSNISYCLEKRNEIESSLRDDLSKVMTDLEPIKRQSNEIYDNLSAYLKELNAIKVAHSEDKKSVSQSILNHIQESRAVMELVEKRVDEQNKIIENANKMVHKSDQRIKENSVALKNYLEEGLSELEQHLDCEIAGLKAGKLGFISKLERLESEMLKALKSNQSGKKAEMGIRMARDNAEKIALIELYLEEM